MAVYKIEKLSSAFLLNVSHSLANFAAHECLKMKQPLGPTKLSELVSESIQRLVELLTELSVAVVEIRMEVGVVDGRASVVRVKMKLVNDKLGIFEEVIPRQACAVQT